MPRALLVVVLVGCWSASAPAAERAQGTVFEDLNGNGRREAGEPGVADVRVSNGAEIVRTDAEGRYALPASDDMTVFVLKPRGWQVALDAYNVPRAYYMHRPGGGHAGKYPGVAPTGPLPASIDFGLRKQDEPERFDVLLFGDPQVFSKHDLDLYAHDILEPLLGTRAAFVAALGDLVHERLELHEPLVRANAHLGLPFYYVAGNHDMDVTAPDDDSANDAYERCFGPAYYAFDYGPVHFLVLENIEWHGETPEKKAGYRAGLGARQLEFIRNDLAQLPPEQLVVLLMHIPIRELAGEERAELFKLLAARPHCVSFSGHTHFWNTWFLGEKDGWPGKEPHVHTTIGATCGSWWTGLEDEVGIPHTTMRDGAPNNWCVVSFDGPRVENVQLRAARRPAEHQMNIYAPDGIAADKLAEAEVLVNVFTGTERSIVEMRMAGSPGTEWVKLEHVQREDPQYAALKSDEGKRPPPKKLPKPIKCPHLWAGRLPEDLKPGTHCLEVRTTDLYGRTHVGRRLLRVEEPAEARTPS